MGINLIIITIIELR